MRHPSFMMKYFEFLVKGFFLFFDAFVKVPKIIARGGKQSRMPISNCIY